MQPIKLFDIETSEVKGKVSVYQIRGLIDDLLRMDLSRAPYKGNPYKSIQQYFYFCSAPTDKRCTNEKSVTHSDTANIINKLTTEEIDQYSKQYIEKDIHFKKLVKSKRIQIEDDETQTEFLYRLFEYKTTVFNQEAYDILINCAKKKDYSEWNDFRGRFRDRKIFLKGADLNHLILDGIDFGTVHLENSKIFCVSLKKANLGNVNLNNADIYDSDFSQSNMSHSYLEGTSFSLVNLSGTTLLYAKNDSKTSFFSCDISKTTDIQLANWEIAKYDQSLRQLVEKINRKKEWEQWYNVHRVLKLPVKYFWMLTDYGTSIKWLTIVFFLFALFFGILYHSIPGLVDGLEGGYENHPDLRLLRALYFSVVTMTTLGFGDIHAVNSVSTSSNIWIIAIGHILLIFQVLLGYFILGALITFFGILLKSPGPIQLYSDKLPPSKRREDEIKKQSNFESKKNFKDYYIKR